MHHARIITGLIAVHIVALGLPTLAEEVTDITQTDAWKTCVRTLRITEELAQKGSYRKRVQKCIDQGNTASTGHDESMRTLLRIERTLQLIRTDPRSRVQTRIVTPPTASEVLWRRGRAQHEQLDTLNVIRENAPRVRPSLRSIKQQALQQSSASKEKASEIYQERWKKAVLACSAHTNNFRRSNCIRNELRQSGQ